MGSDEEPQQEIGQRAADDDAHEADPLSASVRLPNSVTRPSRSPTGGSRKRQQAAAAGGVADLRRPGRAGPGCPVGGRGIGRASAGGTGTGGGVARGGSGFAPGLSRRFAGFAPFGGSGSERAGAGTGLGRAAWGRAGPRAPGAAVGLVQRRREAPAVSGRRQRNPPSDAWVPAGSRRTRRARRPRPRRAAPARPARRADRGTVPRVRSRTGSDRHSATARGPHPHPRRFGEAAETGPGARLAIANAS